MDAHETKVYILILVAGATVGFVLLYFGISVLRKQRKYYNEQKQNFFAEVELLEKERTRIARDLHDEIGPILSITRNLLAAAEGKDEEEQMILRKAEDQVALVNQRLGGIARNLRPSGLMRKGLALALNDFIELARNISKIYFDYDYKVDAQLSQQLKVHVFRIVQELVHNAIRHSEASYIKIHLRQKDQQLLIITRDNGKGFDVDYVREKGFGLSNLQHRAEILGGKMQVRSNISGGTEYLFEIPITQI